MNFEPAGVRHGIPAVGLPLRGYGGRVVGANGMYISTPCPSKLASERLIQTAGGLLPVVGIDFRHSHTAGAWQVGYASLARVSPAGVATLPDGTHVRVPLRGGYPARAGAQNVPQSGLGRSRMRRRVGADPVVSVDYEPGDIGDVEHPVATPSTLNATGAVPKLLVPTANDYGQVLGRAGSNDPVGRAEIDTGLSNAEDFLAGAGRAATSFASYLPSWGQFTTLLVCVLVAVGVWFLWPVLMAARRIA